MQCIANLTFSSIHISNIDILRCTLISYNRVVTHNVCKMHIVSEYWMFSFNMCFMICFLIDLLSQTISYHSCLNASYCKQYPYDTVQAGRLGLRCEFGAQVEFILSVAGPGLFLCKGMHRKILATACQFVVIIDIFQLCHLGDPFCIWLDFSICCHTCSCNALCLVAAKQRLQGFP